MFGFLRKRRRAISITVLTFSVMLVGGIAALPEIAGSGWVRGEIERRLSASLGRVVHLKNRVELEIGLTPRIRLSGFEIENAPSRNQGQMLSIGQLSISGPLVRNLMGDFQVNELIASDVHILVENDKDGKPNWQLSESPPGIEPETTKELKLPLFREVRLSNVALSLQTANSQRAFLFKTIEARNVSIQEEGSVESIFSLDEIPLQFKAKASGLGDFLSGGALKLDAVLKQEAQQISAQGSITENGSANLRLKTSGERLAAWTPLLGIDLPDWNDYLLEGNFKASAGKTKTFSLKDSQLKVGEKVVSGDIEAGFGDGGSIQGNADLTMASHHLLAKGSYAHDGHIQFQFNASGDNLSDLSWIMFSELPALKDYALAGEMNGSFTEGQQLNFENLKLKVGSNDLEGTVNVKPAPLTVSATLHSKKLDLEDLARQGSTQEPRSQASPDTPQGDPKIPFELLKVLDGDIDLQVGQLTTFLGMRFKDAHIKGAIKNGQLNAPIVAGEIFGGKFSGALRAANKTLSANFNGSGFAANPITLLAGGNPFIEGDFALSFNLKSTGESLSEVLKTLNGTISISSQDAELTSPTLKTASSGLFKILSPVLGEKKKSNVECLLLDYQVKNGIAYSLDQTFKLGEVFIFGKGQIDFPQNDLKYNLHVNSRNPSLASLVPPFRAFGKLNNPHFLPSVSGTVASVVDSTQGVASSAFGAVEGMARFLLRDETEDLSGLELCREAAKAEKKLLSSRFGDVLN